MCVVQKLKNFGKNGGARFHEIDFWDDDLVKKHFVQEE